MKAIRSILKAIKVLELFSSGHESLALGEIAQSSGMGNATTWRVVSTLLQKGYLYQKKKRGKYSLGVKFLELGLYNRNDHGNKLGATSYLIDLGNQINETIHFSFWGGSNILYSRAPSCLDDSFKKHPLDWEATPLHSTTVGKLILSGMSEEDVKKYFRHMSKKKRTSHTITDVDEMKRQIASIKREGVAFEFGEYNIEINSVAAGIFDRNGEITGAIAITGPSTRLTVDVLRTIAPVVKLCSLKISQEIRYIS